MSLKNVDEGSPSFAKEEEKIGKFWEEIKAFETCLKQSEGKKPFSFYDGPPFATGLPHYGHILAGTMKDVVTRYAHQTGHYVERRFGWDCHGLPIEFEIEKLLKEQGAIKDMTKEEILKFGIGNYNEECRGIVMRYASEWRKTVTRMGRWIDFDNDYKTMNVEYMESVWWVFKQLFDKDLVYRGFKVMPYSCACTTPLSNFEANSNYKNVSDPAIVVTFPLVEDKDVKFIAWTTTPWTLPSNLALCVHPEKDYVKIQDVPTGNVYIMMKARLVQLYTKKQQQNYKILDTFKGIKLKDTKYVPLFNYFEEKSDVAFKIIMGDFVTEDAGTGIVHCAPGFGEDDYKVCLAQGIIEKENVPCPIDENGRFTKKISEWTGLFVKDADKAIIKKLKDEGRVVNQGSIIHSYPFCWRSDTPLLYRTIPSWFVRVENIKDSLLKNNKDTYWVPDFVKEKRFHNWLQDARDWAVSRNRYWGTPLPIWVSDDYEEVVCIGSIEELEKLSGKKVKDLHRHHIDDITIPSQKGKGKLHRIEEVFDCWFESGSMPYAQCHYPFENKEKFEKTFPADFIAEGLDQTRGWFYTLLVLGSAIFDKAPWKNLIVNGLVLASDGKKMSKRLKNYPDPIEVVDKYGADALRLYLINSPVVRAEPLKFKEEGVFEVVKRVFLPWYNAYRFFIQNAQVFEQEHGHLFSSVEAEETKLTNFMDKWIVSSSQSLVKFVRQEMEGYRLYTVIPKLVTFIDQLTKWYVRMNRPRLKGTQGKEDQFQALIALFNVLMISIRTMAPFTPYLTEFMYQNLKNLIPKEKRQDSIHYLMIPEYDESKVNTDIERMVERMQEVVETGRALRNDKNHGHELKMPLSEFTVLHLNEEYLDDLKNVESYIKEELNCKELKLTSKFEGFITLSSTSNHKELGARLKKKAGAVGKKIKQLSHDELVSILKEKKTIKVEDEDISLSDIVIEKKFVGDAKKYVALSTGDVMVVMNHVVDDKLWAEGMVRVLTAHVQKLRKSAKLFVTDKADVYYSFQNESKLLSALKVHQSLVETLLKGMNVGFAAPEGKEIIQQVEHEENGEKFTIYLTK
eukprot:gene9091-1186_t